MSAVTTTTEGIRVVTLSGEIDHHTGDLLRQALDVRADAPSRVVADMEQVTFMDSSGINVLITAHHALTGADGWLRLAAPHGTVMRTLQIVGVDTVIDCRENLLHALGD
ncbi:anti-sigma factor antagonist [Streptomyces sp. NRRL F-6491]|nr:anti-sigma factor antagonist [Streptomyces sp. NRRL F-6491]KOX37792.1 anti-sigma factor antagonist [Streptomyces sp. NRRL F-6492]